MDFKEQLNAYVKMTGCSAKELADSSGLSEAVISRYRGGSRAPAAGSGKVQMLAAGISALAEKKGLTGLNENAVRCALDASLRRDSVDFDSLISNFNALISVLNINLAEMSRSMNFDASYLSRIRAGQRKPSDIATFLNGVCQFIVRRYSKSGERSVIAGLIGAEPNIAQNDGECFLALVNWMCSGKAEVKDDGVGEFLKKLDDFDLNEYIRAIHFNELKVPSAPFQLPTRKNYYGVKQMRQAELDFFKATVLSSSKEPVFMCSDMPMEEMADDVDFGKKWMFAIAVMLKKGLHLNMVHNLDRPFKEMMLGLESWVPIYMTGQISPYYLKNAQNGVYCHLNYVSGAAVLAGECISGAHAKGKYYFSNSKDEVVYGKEKAACLLEKATPLMKIYRKDSENIYSAFLSADTQAEGRRHNILSSLPIYTISRELLDGILVRNSVSDSEREKLLDYAERQRATVSAILSHSGVLDEVTELAKEEFKEHPAALSLSGAFYEKPLFYTYDEYRTHLKMTRDFAEKNGNYSLKINTENAFRNIQIQIHEGKWVMVSKNQTPVIHFVIRHAKLCKALESFVTPVVE